jgi:hypothetical protein
MLAALSMYLPGQNICDMSDILHRENTGIINKIRQTEKEDNKKKTSRHIMAKQLPPDI